MKQYDVLVVGGRPSGLTAAIVCAQAGLSVLLIEKKKLPVDKACGEGLMPVGWQVLEELQVKIPEGLRTPFLGIHYFNNGIEALADFSEGPGHGMPRVVLVNGLLSAAKKYTNLTISENSELSNYKIDGLVEVELSDNIKVTAKLLIGADGIHSKTRKLLNLEVDDFHYHRWGVRQYFEIPPWNNRVEVHLGHRTEAYVTPNSSTQIGLAILYDSQLPAVTNNSLVDYLEKNFPALVAKLDFSKRQGVLKGAGPLENQSLDVIAHGALLLGDAAGYLDAITGEGLSLGFLQALMLRKTVIPLLKNSNTCLTKKALKSYRKEYQVLVKNYFFMTKLMLKLSYTKPLGKLGIKFLRSHPRLFQHLLSVNMGTKPLFSSELLRKMFSR